MFDPCHTSATSAPRHGHAGSALAPLLLANPQNGNWH